MQENSIHSHNGDITQKIKGCTLKWGGGGDTFHRKYHTDCAKEAMYSTASEDEEPRRGWYTEGLPRPRKISPQFQCGST